MWSFVIELKSDGFVLTRVLLENTKSTFWCETEMLHSPWYCCCCELLLLMEDRCPLKDGWDEVSCCLSSSASPLMFALWGPTGSDVLIKGSWSLLKPKMTSMLWTRPPTATLPPFPISWKLLGERQLSSTMLMVSSDKCIRTASGPADRGTGWWAKGHSSPCHTCFLYLFSLFIHLNLFHIRKPDFTTYMQKTNRKT